MASDYFFGSVQGFDVSSKGSDYCGVVVAGDHVYFAPSADGKVLRVNRFLPYKNLTSWEVYDASAIGGLTCTKFAGMVYDGERYIIFVPFESGVFLRYDTWLPFSSSGSWESFNAVSVGGITCSGYYGGDTDGRYIYFAPCINAATPQFHGHVLRYDTTLPFTSSSAWDSYDAESTDSLTCKGYEYAIYDGDRYVFFIPFGNNYVNPLNVGTHGNILRYDTTLPFGSSSAWEAYDLETNIDADAEGFCGAVIFKNCLFMAGTPQNFNDGIVLKYDLGLPFKSSSSWDKVQLFFEPWVNGAAVCKSRDNDVLFFITQERLVAYDTRLPFDDSGSWWQRLFGQADSLWVFDSEGIAADEMYAYCSVTSDGISSRIRVDPCISQTWTYPSTGVQSFTNWEEYDKYGQLTKTSSRVSFAFDDITFDTAVLLDGGRDAFDTAWEMRFEARITTATGDEEDDVYSYVTILALSDYFCDPLPIAVQLQAEFYAIWEIEWIWDEELEEWVEGDEYFDGYDEYFYIDLNGDYHSISEDVTYYCKLVRSGATLTLYVYSDAGFSTLLFTLSDTISATDKYRLCYANAGQADGSGMTFYGWLQNLNFVSL